MRRCWLPPLFVLLVLCPPRGCAGESSQSKESFEELSARARQALESDRVGEAIQLYGRSTRLRPEWAEGWWHLGTPCRGKTLSFIEQGSGKGQV